MSRRIVGGLCCALALAGCMSGGGQSEVTSCTYPDSARTPAPGFICGEPLEGFPLTRLTSSPPSDEAAEVRIESGRQAVQNRLMLEWMQDWYASLPSADRDRAQALVYDWLSQELRVVRTRTSPAGSIWLLVGLNRTEAQAHQALNHRLLSAGITPPPSTEQDLP
ncbi:hypothetical protein [Saccharospirillum mangrovi]|uniref:hypothetical protein n=1 Tax=Saccharospirillum mangrovi TaxID=2161747 RepID=UPI0013003A0B|nr:hypothetical protein [Saccharospirillum mangrovi]